MLECGQHLEGQCWNDVVHISTSLESQCLNYNEVDKVNRKFNLFFMNTFNDFLLCNCKYKFGNLSLIKLFPVELIF